MFKSHGFPTWKLRHWVIVPSLLFLLTLSNLCLQLIEKRPENDVNSLYVNGDLLLWLTLSIEKHAHCHSEELNILQGSQLLFFICLDKLATNNIGEIVSYLVPIPVKAVQYE
jgi:hypothetical protein